MLWDRMDELGEPLNMNNVIPSTHFLNYLLCYSKNNFILDDVLRDIGVFKFSLLYVVIRLDDIRIIFSTCV